MPIMSTSLDLSYRWLSEKVRFSPYYIDSKSVTLEMYLFSKSHNFTLQQLHEEDKPNLYSEFADNF